MGQAEHIMQAFAVLALLPFALALPSHPAPSYGSYQPAAPYHAAPAYGHPAPAYGHHAPAYGGYGYEEPKHNCTVIDVTEVAEVCTPALETVCEDVELAIKVIVDVEFTFAKKTDVQMVTVCQPGHHGYGGYGHGGYGHNYCKEVAQETAYNVPVVTPVDVPVKVSYP